MKKLNLGVGRHVYATVAIAIAGTLCFGALVAAGNGSSNTSSPNIRKADAPLPSVADIAPMLALDHRSLAAADVSGRSVAAIDAALAGKVTSDWATMKSLLDRRNTALSRTELAPTEPQRGRQQTTAGRSHEVAQAQLAVSSWLESCRQTSLVGVPAEQLARLNALYANRESGLPLEFRICSYSQADLVRLREALSQRARAQQLGESLDESVAAVISRYETVDVIAARNRIGQVLQ